MDSFASAVKMGWEKEKIGWWSLWWFTECLLCTSYWFKCFVLLNSWNTMKHQLWHHYVNFQFSSVAQSCPTLCDPMNRSTPGLPVHYQLPESTQTHVHWVGDAIQPSHPLLSPSPPVCNLSQKIRVFSNEPALHMRWPKCWSFSFNISPSSEHPGLISAHSCSNSLKVTHLVNGWAEVEFLSVSKPSALYWGSIWHPSDEVYVWQDNFSPLASVSLI